MHQPGQRLNLIVQCCGVKLFWFSQLECANCKQCHHLHHRQIALQHSVFFARFLQFLRQKVPTNSNICWTNFFVGCLWKKAHFTTLTTCPEINHKLNIWICTYLSLTTNSYLSRAPNGTRDRQCIFRGGQKSRTFGVVWGSEPTFRAKSELKPGPNI